MNVYTRQDLSVMQAWPLERKIRVTQAKILEWHHHYGGTVAVSVSGGKVIVVSSSTLSSLQATNNIRHASRCHVFFINDFTFIYYCFINDQDFKVLFFALPPAPVLFNAEDKDIKTSMK